MIQSYIIDAIRTPVGKFNGSLSSVRPDDLAAQVIRTLVSRNPKLDPKFIDDVILGNANGAGEENRNVARMAGLLAGLPVTVPGETVNRLCSSGMASVINASRAIKSSELNIVIAGGVENMTRAPFVLSKASSPFGKDVQLFDTSIGWRFVNPKLKEMYGVDAMGETAENVAEMYKISREDQDLMAFNSQMKAAKAQKDGIFEKEIDPVYIPQKKGEPIKFDKDEFIRPETTLEGLAKLQPAFRKGGTVTAGNASGLNDGAAAILMSSANSIKEFDLVPRARVVSSAVVGVEPRIMGIGPVEASRKALKNAGLSFDDMSVIELNEAFAAQGLACIRELGLTDNDPRINPNGGSIAIGHPLGMSGSRLIITALNQLERTNGQYALCTMCIGVGQGYAIIIEKL
ncbi:MAG: 3-oxoadipyl-CoA thiolase [Candidatus Kapabacteria bacterium]|nr:3-oxoadipyl-CoA thiolase [Candidatus Kapabacteria bacterium]